MPQFTIFVPMRRIVTILLLAVLPLCAFAKRHKDNTISRRDSLITEATKHLGKRYQYAAKGPNRFDCSGFTGYVFRQFGYELAASSASQYLQGEKCAVENAKKGDLIFFKGSNVKSKGVGHVGIVCEVQPDGKNTTLRFIHASVNSGITIDNYPETAYYRARFIGIKRIIGEEEPTLDLHESEQETEQEELVPVQEEEVKKEEEKREAEPQPEVKPIEVVVQDDTIFHEVKKKETLFKISRKYGCTVEDLMKWNHLTNTYLSLGQKLAIIKSKEVISEEKKEEREPQPVVQPEREEKSDTITHTVQPKETLYRISKNYNCTVEEIQTWNHLTGNDLKIGQQLIIVRKK